MAINFRQAASEAFSGFASRARAWAPGGINATARFAGAGAKYGKRLAPWAIGGAVAGAGAGAYLGVRYNTGRTKAESDKQIAYGMFNGAMMGAAALSLSRGGMMGYKAWRNRAKSSPIVSANVAGTKGGGPIRTTYLNPNVKVRSTAFPSAGMGSTRIGSANEGISRYLPAWANRPINMMQGPRG